MDWLVFLSGPIIGAIIGYFTNWIAVKMLFRPLKPVYIGRFHVPFTPGIIPRRKAAFAKSIGDTVGQTLLTPQDVERLLRSDKVKDAICHEVMLELIKLQNYNTLQDIALSFAGEERYDSAKQKIEDFLLKRMIAGIQRFDLEAFLLADGGAQIKEKMKGSLFSLFITEDTIKTFAGPLAAQFSQIVEERGAEFLRPILKEEIDKIVNTNTADALSHIGFDEEAAKELTIKVYESVILDKIINIVRDFDFAALVEARIEKMDVLEVERMLLSVIKKELSAVVNLGAIIGFLLGLFNSLTALL